MRQQAEQTAKSIYVMRLALGYRRLWSSYKRNPEKYLLRSFRKAAKNVPFYKKVLKNHGIQDTSVIRTVADFQRLVPIIDKTQVFHNPIEEICTEGDLKHVQAIFTSSGTSGFHSFGFATYRSVRRLQHAVDLTLATFFEAHKRRTLLVNSLPASSPIPTRLATVACAGVRADSVCAIVKKLHPSFEQIVIAGDPLFLKEVVETGQAGGMDWKSLEVHLIAGGDSFAESWRTYLRERLGPRSRILGSMGLSEIGLHLFFETEELLQIRRAANENKALREALFGKNALAAPPLYHYDPSKLFVETTPSRNPPQRSTLVLSTLDPETPIPLFRYNTGDPAKNFSPETLRNTLAAFGYPIQTLRISLPCIAVYGRGPEIPVGETTITAEIIKEGLFENASIAEALTGNFRASVGDTGLQIDVQLKPGGVFPPIVPDLVNALARHLPVLFRVRLHAFEDFPFNMTVDWEHKLQFISKPRAPYFHPPSLSENKGGSQP